MFKIDKLIIFDIMGKMGHFKKYYSNVSSLTYEIPPRTVLTGMIASILGDYPRDSYYSIFSPENCKLSVKIITPSKKHFECMNYFNHKGEHTQIRLELLLPQLQDDLIVYRIYFWHKDDDILLRLQNKIKNSHLGYGIYLGQRQFKAFARYMDSYGKDDIFTVDSKDFVFLNTLTFKDNIVELSKDNEVDIVEAFMPCNMTKSKEGREQKSMTNIVYEREGKQLYGKFKEILQVENEYISFYTPIHKITSL